MMDYDKNKTLSRLRVLQWSMYIIIVFSFMLPSFHRVSPSIMGPDLVTDLNLTMATFGFVGLAYTWVYAFAQAPLGTLLDRFGARRGITIILFMAAVGSFTLSVANSFISLVFARVLIALAVSGFCIGGAKVISVWFTTKQYPLMWGLYMGLANLGSVLATSPLSKMMSHYGWRNAMLYVAIYSLILGIIAFLFLRDKPADKNLPSPDELAGEKAEVQPTETAAMEKVPFKTVLAMPVLWLIGLVCIGLNSGAQVFPSMYEGIFLTNVYGFDKTVIGGIISWFAWGMVIGCFLSGPIIRVLGTRKTILVGTSLFLINWLFFTFQAGSMGITGLKVFNFLVGFLQLIVVPTTFVFIKEIMPFSRLGTAMGIVNTFAWVLGTGLFQQLWGVVIGSVAKGATLIPLGAFQAAFGVSVVTMVLAVISAVLICKGKLGQQVTDNNINKAI